MTRNSDFFMDIHHQVITRCNRLSRKEGVVTKSNISILHQKIQIIGNKLIEIDLVLK